MSSVSLFARTTAKLLLSAAPAAILVAPAPAFAQTAFGGPNVTNAGTVTGGAVLSGGTAPTFSGHTTANTGAAETSVITLNASKSILNWDQFVLDANDTLQFVFASNQHIAVNRILGGSGTQINGTLTGNGNVWFFDSAGIAVGNGAVINVAGLLLSTGGITDSDLFGSDYNFTLADATNGITVANGASLTATNGAITLVAPSVTFAGSATASGSIALIGAESVEIGFDADLDAYASITVTEGTNQATGINVTQDASFNAAAVASGGKTYLIAAGAGAGLGSIVLGGVAADRVEFVEGDVVLYSAGTVTTPRSIVSGGALQGLGSATGGQDLSIGAINVSAGNLNAIAVDEVIVSDAVSVSGNARFEAGGNLTVNTAVTAGGDYTIRADDWYGSAAFNPVEGGDINIEDTLGGLTIGNVTATDDLRITAENGGLTITGGGVTASGGNVVLATTGSGDILLDSAVTDTGADDTVTLTSAGQISQSSGIITAGTLTGTAGGVASLTTQNQIGTLAGFTAGNGFTLFDEDGLTVSGTVSGASGPVLINTSDTGAGTAADLIINAGISSTAGQVTLIAERNLSMADGLTVSGKLGVTLTGASIALDDNTLTALGNNITLNGATTLAGNNVLSTGSGSATFNGTINGAGALTVNSQGTTTFNGAVGGITALSALTTDTGGTTVLNGGTVNTTGSQSYGDALTLGANTTVTSSGSGNISFGSTVNGAHSLTVNTAGVTSFTGAVGGSTALASLTTDSAGTNVLGGNVTTTGNQSYGGASTLAGDATSTAGSISFGGALTLNGTGTRTISGTAATFQSVDSAVAGAASLTVDTSGATTFNGAIGGTGAINALTVDAQSATFSGTNSVASLDVDVTSGGVAFQNDKTLTLVGVTAGSGNIDIAATGNLILQGNVTGAKSGATFVQLTASGGITGSGVVGGDIVTLTADSIGSGPVPVNTDANALEIFTSGAAFISEMDSVVIQYSSVGSLGLSASGDVSINGLTGSAIGITAFGAGSDILVYGNPLASTGGLVLNAGGNLDFIGAVDVSADMGMSLLAGGTISASGGAVLTASDISLTAADWGGDIFLASTLQESQDLWVTDTAGGLTAGGLSAARNLSIVTTNGGNLEVQGAAAGGNLSLDSAGDLALTGAIDATGDTVTLNADGAISQTAAGAITAATLTGSAGGEASLDGAANQITNLGAFTAAGLQLTDLGGLAVSGAIAGGTGAVELSTSGDLTVNAAVSGDAVSLTASGASSDVLINGAVTADLVNLHATGTGGTVSQTAAGAITADQLAVTALGAVTLTAASNDIDMLLGSSGDGLAFADVDGFAVSGTIDGGAGGIDLEAGGDLTLGTATLVTDSSGPITLTTTGSGSDILLDAATVDAGSGTVTLISAANISQTSGVVTAGILTGSSAGSTAMTGSNDITSLDMFSAGSTLSLVDSNGLAITGAVQAGGDVGITTSGSLTVGESVSSTGGAIALTATGAGSDIAVNAAIAAQAGSVSLNAQDSISGNSLGTIASGTTTTLTATDGSIALAGDISAGGTVTASAPLGIALAGVSSSGGDVSLQSAGNIATGALVGSDVALSAGGTIVTGAIGARDDIVLRSTGSTSTGALTSGTGADTAGAGDTLAGSTLAGGDVNAAANGIVVGPVRANGAGSDIVLNGGAGGIGHGAQDLDLAAGGNIALTGAARGRDIALNAGGTVTTGALTARDDIAIRAAGSATLGALVSGATVDGLGPVDVSGAADQMLPGITLAGHDIDVLGQPASATSATANGIGSEIRGLTPPSVASLIPESVLSRLRPSTRSLLERLLLRY